MKIKIGFIGCGNMGQVLVASLLKKKIFKNSEIGAATAHPEKGTSLRRKFRITVFETNRELVRSASIIVLAVKPQQMREVLQEITSDITPKHLVLTLAAGLDGAFYFRYLPAGTRLIRAMPNIPSLLGIGATGLFASDSRTPRDRRLALKIFSSVGKALYVPEEGSLDIVTALSGAGPAFVYYFIDSMIRGATELGLPETIARTLFLETIKGAVAMVEEGKDSIETLISRVASKGGTTEAGLCFLRTNDVSDLLMKTIEAAARRAKEMRGSF
ncbi:MAG: pyrroline-5-carboxylate reductase [Deltaproteobacteria bacterium]|nr:pyrroline-5-carboxylate reductase [Deltaproteobacteria bacterium]